MRLVPALLRDTRAAAAAEMALMLPVLTGILFATVEAGNYFWNEHILVKAVRDGARYAARRDLTTFTACAGSDATSLGTIYSDTRNLVKTGVLSGGSNSFVLWTDADFSMTVACSTTAGTTTLGGFYGGVKNSAGTVVGAPIVTVAASVTYQTVLGTLGFKAGTYKLNAEQQAAVIGW